MNARDFFPTSRGFRETLTVHPVGCQCAEWCAPVAEPVCTRTGDHAENCCCMDCDTVTDARDQGDYEVEHQCECCGALSCDECEIDTIEWTDPESGYWAEHGCLTHRCGVSS